MMRESTSGPPHLRHEHHHFHPHQENEAEDEPSANPFQPLPAPNLNPSFINFTDRELEELQNVSGDPNGGNYFGETSLYKNLTGSGDGKVPGPSELKTTIYTIVIPVMVGCCILTILVNLVIVVSARWCRKPMSPTLYFSISLALADAYASLVLGTGLVVNSYLPTVYDINITNECFQLTLEVLR